MADNNDILSLLIAHKENLRVANLTVQSCKDQQDAAMAAWKALDVRKDKDQWPAAKARFDRAFAMLGEALQAVDDLLIVGDDLIARAKGE